jgi:site-specific DNA-methyltransferase (adenine-specific)
MSNSRAYGPLEVSPGIMRPDEIDFGDRRRQDYEDGGELETSILEKGIMQSLLVLRRDNNRPLLLTGGRRFRIAEKHGLDIPVLIAAKPLDPLDIRTIELAENIYRKDLAYSEKCALVDEINSLMQAKYGNRLPGQAAVDKDGNKVGHTMADTAKILGVDVSTVAKDIKLAQAMEILPELKNLKNKHEAQKMLDKLLDQHDREQKAEVVRKQLGSGNPAKQKLANSYIVKDFFEGIGQIPDSSIDFVECDPYYGIDLITLYEKKYGHTSQYAKETYTDCPPEIYDRYIRQIMKENYRVMVDGSWGICWFAMEPNFEPTFQAIKDAGFFVRRVPGFWVQPTGAAYNPNLLLTSTIDSFFYFRKGQVHLCKPGSFNTYFSNTVPPTRKMHPTERPIELYEKIFTTFAKPGSKVLIDFAGSGNGLLAAANLAMIPIGFDLGQDYKHAYTIRVFEGDLGHYRSLKSNDDQS